MSMWAFIISLRDIVASAWVAVIALAVMVGIWLKNRTRRI